jgi:hypothetical protein
LTSDGSKMEAIRGTVFKVKAFLESKGYRDIMAVHRARVPVVKFEDRDVPVC